jgi:hypothetical protein
MKCLDESVDRFDAIISLPEDRKIKEDFGRKVVLDVDTQEKEIAAHFFPLNIVYDIEAKTEWMAAYTEYHNNIRQWTKFDLEVLMPIYKYKLPVIKLGKNTPKEAICQVFENVNKGGVALTVFELVTATFAADDFDLREDWEIRKTEIGEKVKWLTKERNNSAVVDNSSFLTAMTLLSRYNANINGGPAVSCKRSDVLNLNKQDYQDNADALTKGFIQAGRFLEEQRIFSERNLPYATQLIPLSVMFPLLKSRAEDGTVRNKLTRWYWCGVFGEMYGSANETRYVNDIVGLMKWLDNDEELPDTISRANFQPERLLTLQSRTSAAYKGVMSLILKAKALDFISGKEMDFTVFSDENIDIHHIFPVAHCNQNNIPSRKYNSIINKTPLSQRSNRKISGDAPSVYLSRIVKSGNVTEDCLNSALKSHLINVTNIRADDFAEYFVNRAKSLLKLISSAMGKKVQNLNSDEVIKEFGASLED